MAAGGVAVGSQPVIRCPPLAERRPLSPELRRRVRERWRQTWFEPFGYSLEEKEEEEDGWGGR